MLPRYLDLDRANRVAQGHTVIATARRLEVLAGLAEQGLVTCELDVTKPDSIARLTKRLSGGLDILVNNA